MLKVNLAIIGKISLAGQKATLKSVQLLGNLYENIISRVFRNRQHTNKVSKLWGTNNILPFTYDSAICSKAEELNHPDVPERDGDI